MVEHENSHALGSNSHMASSVLGVRLLGGGEVEDFSLRAVSAALHPSQMNGWNTWNRLTLKPVS